MMQGHATTFGQGDLKVRIANNRTFTPEEWAEMAADRIVSVSDSAPPPIRDQAHAFGGQVAQIVSHYIRNAVEEERQKWLTEVRNG